MPDRNGENPFEDLPLPKDIPWKLVAVSPDMMDVTFCNKLFPFAWHSSISISVYEPPLNELPENFCAGRITYIKVGTTITGYQPTREGIGQVYEEFDNIPIEDQTAALDRILRTYFACYGVLLNVAVFPNPPGKYHLEDYPHIYDAQPKKRDLYQPSTESGEVLSASNSKVSTNHSFASTHTTETGLEANAISTVTAEIEPGVKIGSEISAGLTHKWGQTLKDTQSTTADASRERRETQSTTTEIEQMYNLLTGYHTGTNRFIALMLPRPHILQPTNRRTFIHGVRIIEGIQEYFLVVARPREVEGICIEALLETGHFPEDVELKDPPLEYETKTVVFRVSQRAEKKHFFTPQETKPLDTNFAVPSGWVIDFDAGSSGHPGMEEFNNTSNQQAQDNWVLNYGATSDTVASVWGSIVGGGGFGSDAIFNADYRVFLRSVEPKPTELEPVADVAELIVTARQLCVCITSGDPCPDVGEIKHGQGRYHESVVDEIPISISSSVLRSNVTKHSVLPAVQELIRKIGYSMITSWRHRTRNPIGSVSFLDSDFFKNRLTSILPKEVLDRPLGSISGLPDEVIAFFGKDSLGSMALALDLSNFVAKTGLSIESAIRARRTLLGMSAMSGDDSDRQ